MSAGAYDAADSIVPRSWSWYVLISYPIVSLLGIVSIARLTAVGSVLASSLGSLALVVLVAVLGVVSLPAIRRDVAFVRARETEWEPTWREYVGAGIAPPLGVSILGALVAGLGVAVALLIGTFVVSTITVSIAYLYNRHRHVGLLIK